MFSPSGFPRTLWARSPHQTTDKFSTIQPARTGEAIEIGLFYSRGLQQTQIEPLGEILLARRFPTGEDVWALRRSAPFDASKVPQLAQLQAGSLTLPGATWMSPEFAPGHSLESIGFDPAGRPRERRLGSGCRGHWSEVVIHAGPTSPKKLSAFDVWARVGEGLSTRALLFPRPREPVGGLPRSCRPRWAFGAGARSPSGRLGHSPPRQPQMTSL
jgi:hypothetical protein